MIQPQAIKVLNAIVATATSSGIGGGAIGRTSLQFTASGISAGNCVFTVEVSNDGVNWIAYNRLITNITKTVSQTDIGVASLTLSSNVTAVVIIPDPFAFFRVTGTVTTDGAYTCVAYII